jgi:aerobic-type carbon monoxide dehydrogenase small subunit (CoxS/CutS family)
MAKTKGRGVLKTVDGTISIRLNINGRDQAWKVGPGEYLLDALRREGYKGAKKGCDNGDCGTCTILLEGRPVLACMMFAAQAHGRRITTIEGMGTPDQPHPIQQAFVESGAVQCGFCIPGMVLATKALLDEDPDPDEKAVRRALDGNLCRCTGYVKQVEAALLAAKKLRKGE